MCLFFLQYMSFFLLFFLLYLCPDQIWWRFTASPLFSSLSPPSLFSLACQTVYFFTIIFFSFTRSSRSRQSCVLFIDCYRDEKTLNTFESRSDGWISFFFSFKISSKSSLIRLPDLSYVYNEYTKKQNTNSTRTRFLRPKKLYGVINDL